MLISVTFDVLKLDKSNEVVLQAKNMPHILVTFDVSKAEQSIEVRFVQFANISLLSALRGIFLLESV